MITQKHSSGMKSRVLMLFAACMIAATAIAQPHFGKSVDNKQDAQDPNEIELRAFVQQAEKELKLTLLVGNQYANDKIRAPKNLKGLDYGNLLSILSINEYTAFRTDNLIQIIPLKLARSSSIPVVEENGKYYEDEYVTEYVFLKKSCSQKLLPVLRPMVPQHSHMAANLERQMIITDSYGNIKRIKKVIEKIESDMVAPQDCGVSAGSPKSEVKGLKG